MQNYDEGRFTENGQGLGTVSDEMVRQRAKEIAIINGRTDGKVTENDLDEAYRELTGRERLNPEETKAEKLEESERWPEVSVSEGTQAPTFAAPDEQTFVEKLVEEGMEDAEHDKALNDTLENQRRDKAA